MFLNSKFEFKKKQKNKWKKIFFTQFESWKVDAEFFWTCKIESFWYAAKITSNIKQKTKLIKIELIKFTVETFSKMETKVQTKLG